jgi:DNA sulfur modification protein DndB
MATTRRTKRATREELPDELANSFYEFECVQFLQSKHNAWVATIPARQIHSLFALREARASNPLEWWQRGINFSRVKKLVKYVIDAMLSNRQKRYILPCVTVAINGDVDFEEYFQDRNDRHSGILKVQYGAVFCCVDGQHRLCGLGDSFSAQPDLMQCESIAVMFFVDLGGHFKEQAFLDINTNAVRPSPSIFALFNHNDPIAEAARQVATTIHAFKLVTDMENTNIRPRDTLNIFTLNAINAACKELWKGIELEENVDLVAETLQFWSIVEKHMGAWKIIRSLNVNKSLFLSDYIACNALTLMALGMLGNVLRKEGTDWESVLPRLATVDWGRHNPEWRDLFIFNGNLVKTQQTCRAFATWLYGHVKTSDKPAE